MVAECKDLIGKKVRSVTQDKSGGFLTFVFDDDSTATFETYADCCSSTWIEHLELPTDVEGATLIDVEDVGMGVSDDPSYECLQLYETRFKTDRGDIVVEYRNSSNGYYGGSLERVGGPR